MVFQNDRFWRATHGACGRKRGAQARRELTRPVSTFGLFPPSTIVRIDSRGGGDIPKVVGPSPLVPSPTIPPRPPLSTGNSVSLACVLGKKKKRRGQTRSFCRKQARVDERLQNLETCSVSVLVEDARRYDRSRRSPINKVPRIRRRARCAYSLSKKERVPCAAVLRPSSTLLIVSGQRHGARVSIVST